MRTLLYFARRYPGHTAVMVLCLILAASVQGLGLVTVLPIISIATGAPGAAPLESAVRGGLALVGIEPTLGHLLSLLALAFVLKAALVLLANRRVGYTVARCATDLRLELLEALLATRWSYYTRQPVGAAANAMATEADRASLAYFYLAEACALTATAVVYAGIALGTSWPATLGAGAVGALTLLGMNALVRMSARAGRRQTRLLKSLLSRLTDSLQVVKLLKSMGRESLIGPLLAEETRLLHRQLRRRVFSKEALTALQEPVLAVFLCLYLYAALALWGMPLSAVALLAMAFWQVLGSLNKVQRKVQLVATEASALWSIRAMIDRARAQAEPRGGARRPSLQRGIALDRVSLRYDGAPVLRDASLEIPAGEITALSGASGSGKTSLLDLVTGLVAPERGRVLVDGVPLAELDLQAWRRMIGYVAQEMLTLHDSIRTNVSLGDPAVGDADVERALRDAGAWEFVSRLPEGIHASMGERGALFSGGQRQRIAIARALVHRPLLLILDEATAALDPESEAALLAAVAGLRGRATVLAVSHQPALAGIADHSYRVEDGALAPVPAAPAADRVVA